LGVQQRGDQRDALGAKASAGGGEAHDPHLDLGRQRRPLRGRQDRGLQAALAPDKHPVLGAQSLGPAKIHLAPLVQARHHVHALPGQSRQRDILAVGAVCQEDVAGRETFPEPVEESQVMLVKMAQRHVQQRPAGQREEHHQLEHGKTAAGLLAGGLRELLLVGRRVRQLHRTAIDHLDRAALPPGAGACALLGGPGGGGQDAFQALPRQALAGLDVGRGAFIHRLPGVQAGQGLHLADHLAAGRAGLEHLPEKALAGQAQGEGPLAAVGAFVGAGKQVDGDEVGQVPGQLLEGGLAEVGGATAAQGGEPGAEGGKVRRLHWHSNTTVPLDTPAKMAPMNDTPGTLAALKAEYHRLRQSLARTGYLSQGSVQQRSVATSGRTGYQWTRKVVQKTVSVALSREQFAAMAQAVANERKLWKTIQEMERISRRIIFASAPDTRRRKRLSKKVLGLH
jgi:hypothetical protein